MKINFYGDVADLMPGIEELSADLGISTESSGFPVEVQKSGTGLRISLKQSSALICYGGGKSQFFRALSHLTAHIGQAPLEINESSAFDTLGAMVDASRNTVPTVMTIKTFLRKLALMGFNALMIYMEDTFEVPYNPYFGYMRGKYSFSELSECDTYADLFGIEMIPCIQTLAHLPRALQWKCYEDICDTPDILLAGEPETYHFIEDMIVAASAPFRSKKIHLGMDEAHFIGLGKYLTKNGPKDRFEILNSHLAAVADISRKHGLSPIIYSDMYFRLIDPSGDYAADNIPQEITKLIPKNVQLNYWDYFNADKDFYLKKISQHEQMKKGTMFSGGIWTWNGLTVSYSKSILTTLPAIAACKELGVREVIATLWGDDGAETHFFQSLFGLQLFAELSYCDRFKMDCVKTRFHECTGGNPDAFLDLDKVDNVTENPENHAAVNTSKLALYQDVMMGLFDRNLQGYGLSEHYTGLAAKFSEYAAEPNEWAYLFKPIAQLCNLLSVKAELGIELKDAYSRKDIPRLRALILKLSDAIEKVTLLREEYMQMWLKDFKPFGLEVMDIRLGAVGTRLEYARQRLSDYLDGKTTSLPELEEPRLFHDCREGSEKDTLCRFNRWHQTVTASYIGHNIP